MLGTRLCTLRKLYGYTKEQIASYLGVTQDYINEIEQNIRIATSTEIVKLSNLFCIQVSELIHPTVENVLMSFVNNVGVLSKDDMKAISVVNNIAINANSMTYLIEKNTDVGAFTEQERKIYKNTLQAQAIKTGIHVL